MRVFEPALRQLQPGQWSVFGPTSFRRYLEENGFDSRRVDTAAHISVDSLDDLAPELREAGAMVLRLGKATDGPGTQFAIVGTPGRVEDFFLVDEEVYTQEDPEVCHPQSDPGEMLPYYLLPRLTERCMVHLAFASGLMGHALGLDRPWPTSAPAMGAGTFSFTVVPYPGAAALEHTAGQVEIDALFVGRRRGKETVFVVESKTGPASSLAKHKLVYAARAVEPRLGATPLVPVYLRCEDRGSTVKFDVVECTGWECELTEIQALKHRRLLLDLGAVI